MFPTQLLGTSLTGRLGNGVWWLPSFAGGSWLALATKVIQVTYAVIPMRHVVFSHLDLTPAAARVLDPQLTWNGWPVPFALQLVVLAGLGLVTFAVAVKRFSKTD